MSALPPVFPICGNSFSLTGGIIRNNDGKDIYDITNPSPSFNVPISGSTHVYFTMTFTADGDYIPAAVISIFGQCQLRMFPNRVDVMRYFGRTVSVMRPAYLTFMLFGQNFCRQSMPCRSLIKCMNIIFGYFYFQPI